MKDVRYCSTFLDVVVQRSSHEAERTAFTFLENGESESDRITFSELDLDARSIAALLKTHAREGDRVLLLYPPGLDFIRSFIGCLYAGMIAVPAYPPRRNRSIDRLRAIAADAEAALILTTLQGAEALDRTGEAALNVPQLVLDRPSMPSPDDWKPPKIDRGTIAFLQYTSGSTGTPRGVMVTHGNMIQNNEVIRVSYEHTRDSVFISWLPVFHDMGLIGKVLQPIYTGSRSVLMEPAAFLQKPVRWLQAISKHRGTTSGAPNSAYELCAQKVTEEQKQFLDLSSWRFAFNGAEPVRQSTIQHFFKAFESCGLRLGNIHPCYGLAESTLLVSITPAETEPVTRLMKDGRVLVTCGKLWLDETIRIVDPETRIACSDGIEGEIWISSGSVAAGYWKRPEETAATFQARVANTNEGPFLRTGDLGVLDQGQLFVSGRLKDLIIIRGRNLYPQDIEHSAERSHPALRRDSAAAFAVVVNDQEELAIAAEVSREALRKLNSDEVIRSIRRAIAEEFEVDASRIALLKTSTIPKTSSGKIQRRKCRQDFLEGKLEVIAEWHRAADRSYAEIRDWLIRRLAQDMRIPAAQIGVHDSFASYGLDSQRAVVLSGDLQEWLGRPLPATLAYDYPSVDGLAWHLSNEEPQLTPLAVDSARSTVEPIAIIGIGCRFPMAGNPDEFWNLLRNGTDAIRPAPPGRPHSEALGWGGFLDAIDQFDWEFFGLNRREAEIMDPQQRLLLEVTWEALENAGILPEDLAGSRTGVFVGISSADYLRIHSGNPAVTDPYAATGNALSIAANRISYLLDLRGPSWAVDTACSSSLVALHQACQSLRRGECDIALCGGVNLILDAGVTSVFTRAGMMSPTHRCRTFDAKADGYVRGEGAAMIVLKRLSDAERSGDPVWASVIGTAVNQDGRSNGLTAPNGPAQQAVILAAMQDAGIEASAVGYVEAHGTGTPLGDPIEINSLKEVVKKARVGSLKTNIGHLEAAAGIAGLIKAALALHHKQIPPHLHLENLNPHIALERSGLSIPKTLEEWESDVAPRIAGVSSFGFGGTNAHAILKEAPTALAARERRLSPSTLFQRKRCWIPDAAQPVRKLPQIAHAPDTHVWETTVTGKRPEMLPFTFFADMAVSAASEIAGGVRQRIRNLEIRKPVFVSQDHAATLQIVLKPGPGTRLDLKVYNRESGSWILSVTAEIENAS